MLKEAGGRYAVTGDLAINAYVDPVFTADAEIVIALSDVDRFAQALLELGDRIERHPFSLNFRKRGSDLSLQVSTDPANQGLLDRAVTKEVVAVQVKVASLSDLVEGKIRAWSDPERRLSKRVKDQADLLRIAERYPEMVELLPERLKAEMAEDRARRTQRARQDISRVQGPKTEPDPPDIDR